MDRSPPGRRPRSRSRRLKHYVGLVLRLSLFAVILVAAISLTVGTGVAPVDGAVDDAAAGVGEFLGDAFPAPPDDGAPAAETQESVNASTERARLELAVHERVNEVRRERGLEPLAFDTDLRAVARYHSEDMAEQGYFSHTGRNGSSFEDRYERFDYRCRVPTDGFSYKTGGENLFTMQSPVELAPEDVADRAVQGWLDSPGHRRNLLDPDWRREGIGVARADDGRLYVTQNFC